MRHLFSSVVRVLEPAMTVEKGAISSTGWQPVMQMFDRNYGKLSYLKCRLDLQFLRPGKDVIPAVNGLPTGRSGVLFCSITPYLKAGQRLEFVAGPIKGTFALEVTPDEAQEYRGAHHIEVFVVEVSAHQLNAIFPAREPTEGVLD